MNVVFLGGGSMRILPILRGVFHLAPDAFRAGEIRLVDRELDRAEAVGRLAMACPEYQDVRCKISWTTDVDSALEGADALYLTMGARSEPTETLAALAAQEHGYFSSDQLSINGAFLSLRLGAVIMGLARKMERLCPNAMMLIFPNPVAVYSCMVNNHTKIKALGICGGFNNHRWDLSRLCGRDEFDPKWDVVAAGVNHLSFILRGKRKGEDLYGELMPRILNENWKCMEIQGSSPLAAKALRRALENLYKLYRRHGTIVFSTEGDGLAHIATQDALDLQAERLGAMTDFNPGTIAGTIKERQKAQAAEFLGAAASPQQVDWSVPWPRSPRYGRDVTDITIPIFEALAGLRKMRIVASRANKGAVDGFPGDFALEYTMDIFKDSVTPIENQYVPRPFHGLIASLSEFQTLQAQAIVQHDPKVFADALDAYPINRFTPARNKFFTRMFDIYSDLDPHMRQARNYFA